MGVLTGLSAATGLASSGMAFAQAAKARRQEKQAQQEAKKAYKGAMNSLINPYEAVAGVSTLAFDQARKAALTQAKDAMVAAQEADPRNLAATAGRVQDVLTEQQNQISANREQQIVSQENKIAQEDARLQDEKRRLQEELASGAQQAAADSAAARANYLTQGFSGLTNAVSDIASVPDLYPDRKASNIQDYLGTIPQEQIDQMGTLFNLDFTGKGLPEISSMLVPYYNDILGKGIRK